MIQMSLIKELKNAFSFHGNDKKLITESEGRIILVGVAVVLIAVALISLVARSVGTTRLQSCKGIALAQQRHECLYALANSTDNYSICNLLPNDVSYSCIAGIAERTMNVTACGEINSSASPYNDCITNISYELNNNSYCLLLKGDNVSECAMGVARINQFSNLSYCSIIPNSSQRSICTYVYYYDKALASGIPEYCSYLPQTNNHTVLSAISPTGYANISQNLGTALLSVLEANITASSYCYYSTALSAGNKSMCTYSGGQIASECYNYLNNTPSILNFSNLSDVCSQAPSYAMDLCNYTLFTEVALVRRNVSLCFMISNYTYKNTCIVQLAEKYNDSAYCNYITDNNATQKACYTSATIIQSK